MFLEIENLNKSYGENLILDNLSLKIEKNSMTSIIGESGCGKSTLMNILGFLDVFDSGVYKILEHKNINPHSKMAMLIRRETIGFLYQNYALIDQLSVYENLKIATKYNTKWTKQSDRVKMEEILESVNLKKEYLGKKIYELSGGEQQRVAIARLIIKPCSLILADEPTGSLDVKNKNMVLNLLCELNKMNKTIIIVTHDMDTKNICTNSIMI